MPSVINQSEVEAARLEYQYYTAELDELRAKWAAACKGQREAKDRLILLGCEPEPEECWNDYTARVQKEIEGL